MRPSRANLSGMSSPSLPRVLVIGEGVAPTGYARVIRSIFGPLTGRLDVHQLATRWDSRAHDWPWTLHAAPENDPYGYGMIPDLLDRLRPAFVFLLYDLSFLAPYMEALRASGAPPAVLYVPVESGPVTPELLERLEGAARVVVYTAYARAQVRDAADRVRRTRPDFAFPEPSVIPHGVDTDRFRPLAGDWVAARAAARAALGMGEDSRDAFIVLNANRNQPRKLIDVTIDGFARFARGKPENVKLYLHMGVEDRGWNVILLARRHGIDDRLILTTGDRWHPALTDDALNLVYNACDVGLTTSTGESWGLVSFEHAATGAAQVVPRHTALAGLWEGAAEMVDPVLTLTNPGPLSHAHVVSPEGVAAALERLYGDRAHREGLARAAFANATRPEYRWNAIAKQWMTVFQEVLGEA
jgi:D-inositol-3-phosphate glycosyltransferase